jgi:GTP cyclohydrolase III
VEAEDVWEEEDEEEEGKRVHAGKAPGDVGKASDHKERKKDLKGRGKTSGDLIMLAHMDAQDKRCRW